MDENTITTVFKADISQFSSSTQQLNQYIKTVNSEFEVATSSLGKWSDSTDGLTAKITQLNKVLEAEKLKLQDMKNRYAEMEKAGKANTKEAKNLQIAINNQTAKINKAEKQTEDYKASLDELTKAGVKTKKELDALTDSQEKQGKSAEGVAGKLAKGLGGMALGVAGMAAGAVSGFLGLAESTREVRKELGQLETSFTQAGHSAETADRIYTEFNSVLGDTAKTTEAMQHMAQLADTEEELNTLVKAGTGIFATYGNSLPIEGLMEAANETARTGELTGGLTDAINWAGKSEDEFQKKLDACNSEQERQTLIIETLNELYGEAGEKYNEVNKDAIEAEKAQTRMTLAMAELGAVAEPIMTVLKNSLADLLEAIKPFVELIGTGLKEALSGSAEGAQKLADGLSGIVKTLIDKVNDMLPKVIDLFVELLPTIVNTIITALPGILSTLLSAISQIVGALGDIIPSVIQTIVETIPDLVQAIVDALPLFLDGVMQLVLGIVEALPGIIETLVSSLPDIINTIIDALISFIPQLIDAAITLLMAIIDAIPVIIEALIPELPKIIDAIIDGLLEMLPVLLDGAITLLMAIIDALPTIIQLLIKEVPKIVKTIISSLIKKLPDLIQGATELFMGILEAIPTICIELIKNLPEIITTIVEGLMDGFEDIKEVGLDLIKGLWEGIKGAGKWLWGKVKGFGKKILGWFEDAFKIESPSKVFRDRIGKNIALGIGEGFDDEIGTVTKDMERSMANLTDSLEAEAPGIIGFDSNTPSWVNQLADVIRNQNVTNNYNFDYKFEKMETTKLALHKAQLATKRAIG